MLRREPLRALMLPEELPMVGMLEADEAAVGGRLIPDLGG